MKGRPHADALSQSAITLDHGALHAARDRRAFEIVPIELKAGEHKRPEFLKINPMGKLPVLRDGDVIITETPAILTYLADKYPKAGLAPAIDLTRARHIPAVAVLLRKLLRARADRPRPETRDAAVYAGLGQSRTCARYALGGAETGPLALGERFTAADVMMGSGVAYMLGFKVLPERPEFVGVRRAHRGPTGPQGRQGR